MHSPAPDLYRMFGFDRGDSTDEIGRRISEQDHQLGQQGVPGHDLRRLQLQTVYGILGKDECRGLYDEALDASRPLTWEQLEHLSNFGFFRGEGIARVPENNPYNYPTTPPSPAPLVPPVQSGTPVNPVNPFTPPVTPPQAAPVPAMPVPGQPPYAAQAPLTGAVDRPSAGLRLGMVIVDWIVAGIVFGMILGVLFGDSAGGVLLMGLASAAWFLGFEVLTGGSPAKHMFGYEVRDATTGQRLTWEQSAKRQWWRLVTIVPGLGTLISFIGMIAIGISIDAKEERRGSHDRWAGAEVVRKQGR